MLKINKKVLLSSVAMGAAFVSLTGCGLFGGGASDSKEESTESVAVTEESDNVQATEATEVTKETEIAGLEYEGAVQTDTAKFFTIEKYKDGYYVINTERDNTSQRILVVPDGKEVPEGTGKDVIIVKQPISSSRVDSVSLLSMLESISPETLDKVSLVAGKREKMDVERVAQNMDAGITEYSGSVKNPDVELIKSKNPDLYLANTELLGQDSYKTLLDAGINPVISYYHVEEEPFGRIEWVKVLGVIFGNMDLAENFYQEQKSVFESVDASKAEDKTYIMFCLNKDKNIAYVRRQDDVIAKMGSMAGGKNVMTDTNGMSWEQMTIEDFAEKFKDTDYLIYMTNHADAVASIEDLKGINEKIGEFKAVSEGNVWSTAQDYLLMNNYGEMIKDLNDIFSGANEGNSTENFIHMD